MDEQGAEILMDAKEPPAVSFEWEAEMIKTIKKGTVSFSALEAENKKLRDELESVAHEKSEAERRLEGELETLRGELAEAKREIESLGQGQAEAEKSLRDAEKEFQEKKAECDRWLHGYKHREVEMKKKMAQIAQTVWIDYIIASNCLKHEEKPPAEIKREIYRELQQKKTLYDRMTGAPAFAEIRSWIERNLDVKPERIDTGIKIYAQAS